MYKMAQNQQNPGAQQYPQQQGYGRYYQGYYGQQQPVQTYADTAEARQHAKKKFAIIMGAVAALVVIFVGIFFLMSLAEEEGVVVLEEEQFLVGLTQEEIETLHPPQEVYIDELKLCSFIDENYNCNEKPDAIFQKGDDVYLYIKLRQFSQLQTSDGYLIGISEDVETTGPEGERVEALTGSNVVDLASFVDEEQEFLVLKNKFSTISTIVDTVGRHDVRLSIKDKISGAVAQRTISFVLQ
jgi:hypothetical protein